MSGKFLFPKLENGCFSHIDSTNQILLDHYIGYTLAHALCDEDTNLDLIRFWYRGIGQHVIAQKRLNDISLIVDEPKRERV